ncbi:lipopolysaccharide biosynthesis protein [Christiangramia sabulilitoris]|uniref:Lipopolysaccharide biosynthesis protein n=1 Tax=Christiangramia sabulilitoris TaxID=2583991 RepID=A0A550I2A8_9FLAO|nr:lipopolysaccharide biosynthesis protein [Christiangramia sabulilitoris]TRO65114.1 lipopolysaccharide biosynthesis protein [Christiangramia sabulilitoris]
MSLRKQATSGIAWTFAQQFGNQAIGFVVSLILARILMPEEFGLIGMIAVFIAVGKTLLNAGLTQSLIRSDNLDEEDYSTVFYFNLAASLFIYGVIYISAPLIADFYGQPILINIIRVFCLTFLISAFSAVQGSRLTKKMDFKTLTIVSIPSNIIGGIIGIGMAYTGFGVWSLVWSSLASAFINSVQLWFYSKWSPGFVFNIKKFKDHFNFGYKLTLSELLNSVFNNLFIIVIGRFFSAGQVGFYTRAQTLKQLPVTNISNALNKVTYPLFASIQDDDVRLKRVYKQLMQMVIFVVAPVLVFMAVLAEPLFRFLFTEKWLPAVPYFQILCATGILYPIHSYNLNILNVKGRSDLFLKLEVVKKIIIIITIALTINYGIIALLYGQVFTSVMAFVVNTHYSGKFINYSALEQIYDVLPTVLVAILAGAFVFILDFYLLNHRMDLIRLIGGTFLGVISYFGIAYLLGWNSLKELILILKKKKS